MIEQHTEIRRDVRLVDFVTAASDMLLVVSTTGRTRTVSRDDTVPDVTVALLDVMKDRGFWMAAVVACRAYASAGITTPRAVALRRHDGELTLYVR